MIDAHMGEDPVLLKNPIYLLLFAPNDIPIVIPSLLPLPVCEPIINCIFECRFELDVAAESKMTYG